MRRTDRLSKAEEAALNKTMDKYAKIEYAKIGLPILIARHFVRLGIIAGWVEHDAWMKKRRSKR